MSSSEAAVPFAMARGCAGGADKGRGGRGRGAVKTAPPKSKKTPEKPVAKAELPSSADKGKPKAHCKSKPADAATGAAGGGTKKGLASTGGEGKDIRVNQVCDPFRLGVYRVS